MFERSQIKNTRRWVVKIGSAMLTNNGKGLNTAAFVAWVEQIAGWLQNGNELVLVSSGAVAEGMSRMGWSKRPTSLHELQAAAAIGQMGLVKEWESHFAAHGLHTAQVLLTHDDLINRARYLNARSTLRTLLGLGVVPVVNENDTVANEELRFGDNDTLAALVANLVEADLLVLLTDQQGLYSADPRKDASAQLISQAQAADLSLDRAASDGAGGLGRGGMMTKLRAARLAARSGTATVIASGAVPDGLMRIAAGEEIGTLLTSGQAPEAARKQWLAGHLQVKGRLVLDDGAVKVLKQSGRSLLAVGVKSVSGEFRRGEVVSCVDLNGREIARGLVNYGSAEAGRIAGKPSTSIEAILGYIDDEELIHRDNLVLI
ncbi:MAG: glutamate 5-kinase [Chromatiales bacterium]|jgi:glutamate 5-kinase